MGVGVERTRNTMDMALDCSDVWWCPLLLFGFTGKLIEKDSSPFLLPSPSPCLPEG